MGRSIALILLTAWFMLIGVATGTSTVSAAALYPDNPLVTEQAIFVSDEGMVRLDRESGERVWRALADEQTFEPVMAAGALLVGTGSGLVALDPRSGEVHWRRFRGAPVYSPSVAEGLAFVAARDGQLRAIDPATGEMHWAHRFEGWIYPPALLEDVLVTGGQGTMLTALSPLTGQVLWQRPLGQELVYRPVAGRKLVFVTTFAGETLAIEPASGEIRWRFCDPVPSGSPVVDDERLYLARFDGVLRVLDQASGAPLARRDLGAGVTLPLHVAAGRVVVADAASRVTVLTTTDLSLVWQATLNADLRAGPRLEGDRVTLITGLDYRARSLSEPVSPLRNGTARIDL